MDLVLRKTTESYEEDFCYSELNEKWKLDGNSFYYYKFHSPEQKFHVELVSFWIDTVGPFNCSDPPLWVADISPIAFVTHKEKSPLRIYGAQSLQTGVEFYRDIPNCREDSEAFLSGIAKVFPNNERSTPQASLERLVTVHKPPNQSWQEIIDFLYENVTKARDVLLSYVS